MQYPGEIPNVLLFTHKKLYFIQANTRHNKLQFLAIKYSRLEQHPLHMLLGLLWTIWPPHSVADMAPTQPKNKKIPEFHMLYFHKKEFFRKPHFPIDDNSRQHHNDNLTIVFHIIEWKTLNIKPLQLKETDETILK